jgi:fatty acid desaturase
MYNFEPIRWRWSHFHHHSYTLHTKGPYDYEIQVTKPTDLFFVFLMHLPGGNLLLIFKGFLSFHWETIKHAFGFTTPVMKECIPENERLKCRIFSLIHIFIWIIIIIISFYYETWLPALYFLVPFTYGTTLRNAFDFIQHAGLANNVKDHRLCVRTVKLNPIFSFLYWHMEYHLEHHMFPMVPSYNLKKLHSIIKDQTPSPKNGLWDAYREIIPAIIKQSKDPNYTLKVELPN